MNEQELRSRVKERLNMCMMNKSDFSKLAGLSNGVLSKFLRGGHISNKTFNKISAALTNSVSKEELVIDLNNPASVLNGLEKIDKYIENLNKMIQTYEDKLATLYKLQEMLTKR